jgi:hypothetical protein
VERFKVSVRRQPGESTEAWRARAVALAHAELETRGLVLRSLRLGARGGAPTLPAAGGVIEVNVTGARAPAQSGPER